MLFSLMTSNDIKIKRRLRDFVKYLREIFTSMLSSGSLEFSKIAFLITKIWTQHEDAFQNS